MNYRFSDNPAAKQKKRTALLIVLAAVLIAAGMLLLKFLEQREDALILEDAQSKSSSEQPFNLVRYNGKWYKQNPNLRNVLLIGIDSLGMTKEAVAKQSDFLLVVCIDTEKNTYRTLQLNRDTMADVPQLDMFGQEYGTKNQQLALAYSHSDSEIINCKNTVKAVSNFLYGVDINHFVCVTMDAVPVVNNLVGGVPVFVEDDFSDADPSITQGKTITLSGGQALTFVRARGSMNDPTNIARMERQRVYMSSLHKQAIKKAKEDSDFIMRSLLELSPYITSDCSVNQLTRMFDIALEQDPSEIELVKGKAVQGEEYMEFYADEDALQKQIIDLFFVEDTSRE